MKNRILILIILGFCVAFSLAANGTQETEKTRIGNLTFTHDFANGYPTDETNELLFNEIDFQRACQSYIWSIPIVSMAQWQHAHNVTLGAENGQIVFLNGYDDILGGLTFNATTPYALVFVDLADGPWVIEMPEGEVRGAAHDMWQREITSMTKPGKYVFVGPGQQVSSDLDKDEVSIFQTPTNSIFVGIRLIPTDQDKRMALLNNVSIFPLSEQESPNPRSYMTPDGTSWSAAPPRRIEYWQRLSDIINSEPVDERDRFYHAMLVPLGIEKGKPFNPTEEQTAILTEGVMVGEAMAKAIDFDKRRLVDAHYLDGSRWDIDTTSPPDQRREFYEELDGRASWFYEAVTNNIAMHGMETGEGQVYLTSYKDTDGDWLDGAQNYSLNIPANPPAEVFWSLTLYEVSTRDVIHNDYKISDRGSRTDSLTNTDGSVDLYFGPDEPGFKPCCDLPGSSRHVRIPLPGPQGLPNHS